MSVWRLSMIVLCLFAKATRLFAKVLCLFVKKTICFTYENELNGLLKNTYITITKIKKIPGNIM